MPEDSQTFKIIVIFALVVIVFFAIASFILFKKVMKSKKRSMAKYLGMEVARSRRAGRSLGVVLMELGNDVPRGASEFLPGRTLMVSVFENNLRNTDMLERTGFRVYTIILTETQQLEGSLVVKKRLEKVAADRGWGQVKIGLASYPEHGDTAEALMEYAIQDGNITYND